MAEKVVGSKANHDVEWDIALESITSVKNTKQYGPNILAAIYEIILATFDLLFNDNEGCG